MVREPWDNRIPRWGRMEKCGRCSGLPGAVDDVVVPTSVLKELSFQLSEVSVISPVTLKWLAVSG